ncbi:hypothetical protein [Lactococcus lactis]
MKYKKIFLKDKQKIVVNKGKRFILIHDESLIDYLLDKWENYSEEKPVYVSPFLEIESGELAWHIFDKKFIGLNTIWADKQFLLEHSLTKQFKESTQ